MNTFELDQLSVILNCLIPKEYRKFVTSSDELPSCMYKTIEKIVDANISVRKKCWIGEPLGNAFFVFGEDETGQQLFIDTDIPGALVMLADHKSTSTERRATVLARTFSEWISIV